MVISMFGCIKIISGTAFVTLCFLFPCSFVKESNILCFPCYRVIQSPIPQQKGTGTSHLMCPDCVLLFCEWNYSYFLCLLLEWQCIFCKAGKILTDLWFSFPEFQISWGFFIPYIFGAWCLLHCLLEKNRWKSNFKHTLFDLSPTIA